MALKIGISAFVSAGYTNPVIWRLYEATSGVLIDTHQEIGPHGVIYNFDFLNGIIDIIYRVELYDQPGGTGVGTLIKSHDVTVSTSTLTVDADIETIVDGGNPEDPTSGTQTSPIIASLAGADYSVQQRGIGQLRAVRTVEIVINANGSYTLTGASTFNAGDTYIIKIKPQYVVNPAGSQSASSLYRDILLKTSDYTISATDFGKLILVDGSSSVVTLSMPAITAVVEKVSLFIRNISTVQVQVIILMMTGETLKATGSTSNTFILSRAADVEIIKLGSTMYATSDDQDIRRRGQVEWGYSITINRIWADGTEYLCANMPGIKKAIDTMQVGTVVTYAQWASSVIVNGHTLFPYKGFYALSVDGLHLKVPDLRNRFIRALNGTSSDIERLTQGPGGYQNGQPGEVKITIPTVAREAGVQILGVTDGVHQSAFDQTYIFEAGEETRGENTGLIPLIIM